MARGKKRGRKSGSRYREPEGPTDRDATSFENQWYMRSEDKNRLSNQQREMGRVGRSESAKYDNPKRSSGRGSSGRN